MYFSMCFPINIIIVMCKVLFLIFLVSLAFKNTSKETRKEEYTSEV